MWLLGETWVTIVDYDGAAPWVSSAGFVGLFSYACACVCRVAYGVDLRRGRDGAVGDVGCDTGWENGLRGYYRHDEKCK